MAKKKKAASEAVTAIACSKSRYTSPPVTLRFGPDLEEYFVPEVLLQSLHDLPRSETVEGAIDLPDVGVDTAHVIVHFLYTGQYQTLSSDDEEATTSYGKTDFKKAIAALVAAKKYGLTVLREVVKSEISSCGKRITIVQAAHAIGKDTLASLQEDAGWLQDLVLLKAEQVFQDSDEIFSSASFFSGIKSLKLAKTLGQRVAELYRRRILQLRDRSSESRDDLPVAIDRVLDEIAREVVERRAQAAVEEVVVEAAEEAVEEAVVETDAEAVVEAVEEAVSSTDGVEVIDEAVPAAVPAAVACAPTEVAAQAEQGPVTIEADTEIDLIAVAHPLQETEQELEASYDIVAPPCLSNGMDACELPSVIASAPEPVPSQTEVPSDTQAIAETEPPRRLSKLQMKKLEKKLRAEARARDKLIEEAETAAREMEQKIEIPRTEEEGTADTLQPIPAEEPFEGIVQESGATHAPVATESAVSEHMDPFAGLSKSRKKKLEKRLKEEAAERERRSATNTIPNVATGSDLIEPEPDSAVDVDASDEEICPFRYDHLIRDNGWKDCKPCELYMRTIAITLHAAGLPDVNGLVQ